MRPSSIDVLSVGWAANASSPRFLLASSRSACAASVDDASADGVVLTRPSDVAALGLAAGEAAAVNCSDVGFANGGGGGASVIHWGSLVRVRLR